MLRNWATWRGNGRLGVNPELTLRSICDRGPVESHAVKNQKGIARERLEAAAQYLLFGREGQIACRRGISKALRIKSPVIAGH